MKKLLILVVIFLAVQSEINAQESQRKYRIARLIIDKVQLKEYNRLLKEEIESSLAVEPGVLTLYAVSEIERPNHITILEIYANEAAYQEHIKSPHFLKYKKATASMVEKLELIDVDPLLPAYNLH